MLKEKLVSVVVPVYNVEKYLKRCIESVLNQIFDNYEIILVDDGSKDLSGLICDEYARKYENIQVIHKVNGGLSDARNYGTQNASGLYVTYIDSDDSVIETYLEDLYNLIIKYGADMSVGGFNFIENDVVLNRSEKKEKSYAIKGDEAFEMLLLGKDIYSSACSLMIKRERAMQYLFPLGMYNEDDLTTYKYYLASERVAVTTKQIYNYFQNPGSIMHVLNKQVLDLIYATNNLFTVASKMGDKYIIAANCRKYNIFQQIVSDYPDMIEVYPKEYKEIRDEIKRLQKVILMNRHYSCRMKKNVINNMIKK